MKARIIQLNNEVFGHGGPKRIFYTIAFSLGITFLMYIYLVCAIIFNAVEYKQTDAKSRDLRSVIGVLEVEYLNIAGNITLEKALSLGFKEATNQVFVSRNNIAPKLSFKAN